MNLTEFCNSLEARLSTLPSENERLEVMAKAISQAFKVKPVEVAIFSFDENKEMISFIWPLQLRHAGLLPLSAHNSLVTKTILEMRATLDNSFSTTPHASIFEQFKLGPETPPLPIQKIMSAPLIHQGKIKGVIQVSRKGMTDTEAGDDFTTNQLAALTKIAEVAANHI